MKHRAAAERMAGSGSPRSRPSRAWIPDHWRAAACSLLSLALLSACTEERNPEPIPSAAITSPTFIGSPAQPRPISIQVRENPFLAPGRISTLHTGSFNADVHITPGPLGNDPELVSRKATSLPGGMCSSTVFDAHGNLITFCASLAGFEIHLLEPRTLKSLARYELPSRPSTFAALVTLDPDKVMADTSGGAYFYLDHEGYVVLGDARERIVRIGHRQSEAGSWEFHIADSWDLSDHVPHDCLAPTNWFPAGECDPITSVTPDYDGLIWWVTLRGRIGTLNPKDGSAKVMKLPGEDIQNSIAAADDGVFVVSDHAMYGLTADPDGTPRVMWRETYDRGTKRKEGLINQGAGSTPTLIGDRYVTTNDNADRRVNLLVYRRDPDFLGERLICKVPIFEEDASAAEFSMIAWHRSIILVNTFGYLNAFQQKGWENVPGGIVRIDVREDESGCDTVWTSSERSPSIVAKLSTATGLVYAYTFQPQENGENAWYLTALDPDTGETLFKILTGAGSQFDGNWGVITLGPDGTAYLSTLKGMVAVWDGS